MASYNSSVHVSSEAFAKINANDRLRRLTQVNVTDPNAEVKKHGNIRFARNVHLSPHIEVDNEGNVIASPKTYLDELLAVARDAASSTYEDIFSGPADDNKRLLAEKFKVAAGLSATAVVIMDLAAEAGHRFSFSPEEAIYNTQDPEERADLIKKQIADTAATASAYVDQLTMLLAKKIKEENAAKETPPSN
jgi:hypothetical protein